MIGTVLLIVVAYILVCLATNVVLSYIHARWYTHASWHDEYGNRVVPEEEIAWQSMLWVVYIPLLLGIFFFSRVGLCCEALSRWVMSKVKPK